MTRRLDGSEKLGYIRIKRAVRSLFETGLSHRNTARLARLSHRPSTGQPYIYVHSVILVRYSQPCYSDRLYAIPSGCPETTRLSDDRQPVPSYYVQYSLYICMYNACDTKSQPRAETTKTVSDLDWFGNFPKTVVTLSGLPRSGLIP